MNVERLRRVGRLIVANADDFDMTTACAVKSGPYAYCPAFRYPVAASECGSKMCIFGWGVLLYGDIESIPFFEGMQVFELSEEQARRLYTGDNWPEGFGDWRATAIQAQARIEHFIATDGRE